MSLAVGAGVQPMAGPALLDPVNCAPRSFFLELAQKERTRRARWKKEKSAPRTDTFLRHAIRVWLRYRSRRCVVNYRKIRCSDLGPRRRGRRPRRPGIVFPASRGAERGTIPVRSTIERQRYAKSAATRTCFSGDPGFALRFPFWRGVQRILPLVAFLFGV